MAGPFDDLIPQKPTPALANPFADLIPKSDVTPDSVVRSLASGASFGLADEFAAMMDAATHPVLGRGASGETYGQRYEQNLAKERGLDKAFAEQHPYIDTASKIAGGVGSSVATLPAGLVSVGPSALGNVAKTALTGAGLGGLQGFGEGEGLQDRLERGALGATIGGGVGATVRPLASVGRAIAESAPGRAVSDYVTSPVANAARSIFSSGAPVAENAAQTGALERLATALQRAKMTPEAAGSRLNLLGDQAILADVDPQLLGAATGVKVLPGETRSLAENVLIHRNRATGNRLVGAFEGDQPPPSSYETLTAMQGNKQGVGAREYGAMRGEKLNISQEMQKLRGLSAIQDAEKQIVEDAASTGTQLSPIEIAHRVKQQLNRVADAAMASGTPINKADLRALGDQFESAFWRANPAARTADTAYAKAASLPEHFEAGRSFLSRGSSEKATEASAPGLADLLQRANPQQQLAARVGATNAARETALEGTTPARALARRINESDPVQTKIAELYGPQASKILQQAEAEGVFANTSNRLLGGSQTAEKLSDALDTMGNIGVRATPGQVTPRFTESLKAFVNWVRSPNEAVRNEIGRLTINPNASENQKTLELLAALLKQRAAGNTGSAGLAGALGGQAGGIR